MIKPTQVEKYGGMVYSNEPMDELRKSQCLCLNCSQMKDCPTAQKLYDICVNTGIAVMITRCPDWN